MKVLETYVAFVITLKATSAQFLQQPNPGILFAPVDYEVTLTCSVEDGYLIDWRVLWSNGEKADASSGIAGHILMDRGFILEGVVTTRSTLSLWETDDEINNGSNITCVAQEAGAQRASIIGNVVQVIFYAGAPPPPTNLSVTEDEQGALNISWSLMVIEGAPVNYTLTVLNLNTTSAQPIIIAGLLDQNYAFETSKPCDMYSFTVTAVTAAGNSSPSQEIIFTRNDNSAICFATTSEISSTQHTAAFTSFSVSTTQTDSSQPLTTFNPETQDSSTIILIAAFSIAFAVLMTVLVLVNVMICTFCYKKNKTEVKSDLKDPVYEAPYYDIPRLPSLAEDTGTPFAMTSSSAYDAAGDTQKLPFKDSSPSKSSKNDTESSYVPFAMKSSSAYKMSQNSPSGDCKNLSLPKSSKNLETEDSYVPFVMTSSLAYEISEDSQNLNTEDKSIPTTLFTEDQPFKITDSASDTVSFTMTSSAAYQVSKNHKNFSSDDEIIPTASPSANESSKKLDSDVPLIIASSSADYIPKTCDSDDNIISTASPSSSPSADESSKKHDTEGSLDQFSMTASLAYEVSKNHKNLNFILAASPSADGSFKNFNIKGSTVPIMSSANGVSTNLQSEPTNIND